MGQELRYDTTANGNLIVYNVVDQRKSHVRKGVMVLHLKNTQAPFTDVYTVSTDFTIRASAEEALQEYIFKQEVLEAQIEREISALRKNLRRIKGRIITALDQYNQLTSETKLQEE